MLINSHFCKWLGCCGGEEGRAHGVEAGHSDETGPCRARRGSCCGPCLLHQGVWISPGAMGESEGFFILIYLFFNHQVCILETGRRVERTVIRGKVWETEGHYHWSNDPGKIHSGLY